MSYFDTNFLYYVISPSMLRDKENTLIIFLHNKIKLLEITFLSSLPF